MSKLSPALRTLINAPHARPNIIPAPSHIRSVYEDIARDAARKNVGRPSWLALATAATMTMNSPESLTALFEVATEQSPSSVKDKVNTAEFMREVGLKCISFNGIPRTINLLNYFHDFLPDQILSQMTTSSSRTPTSSNIEQIRARGLALWSSIYAELDKRLLDKLAASHPDLPVHIINSHYGALLNDPPLEGRAGLGRVGRMATSIVAIAALRAQGGVAPQVISHLFGLRKGWVDGTWKGDLQRTKGVEWLASDEGNIWVLDRVDQVVKAIRDTPSGSQPRPRL
ncbi:hypothetical protein P152DRAFT_504607 [Eremomyces bilateralis CBS 781.70]|uniref:Mitochondrial protein n=1 Tax=Eremomyces bilateralis CBS 781.70 TaxID=1392243 RepID=A0A6G1GHG6_9PEZI|nr:uncharacterized protein P152DRAFT_504607 [Eremomyces bilateralis CBS 781.70]KAF1817310.1 hypothetical protein P152DRAFT_504607 [Eremomyces bilateralis CBS 781.70]